MIAEIISVGTELLLGDIVNTNARFISRELAALGISVYFQTTVGDNAHRLLLAFESAFSRSDIVITTGGLGPTEDDLTKETGANFFKKSLVLDIRSLQNISDHFSKQSLNMPESNRKQAMIPEGAHVLYNAHGTAPGCIIEENGKTLIMLPGPPEELVPMFTESVIPYLKGKSNIGYFSTTLRICGVGESAVEQMLKDLIDTQSNPSIAPYAKTSEVHLRLTAAAKDQGEAEELIKPVINEIRKRLGDNIYGTNEATLEETVVNLLKKRGLKLALAESCTGGLIAANLVNVAGVSACLAEGIVCYSNESKITRLGVKPETLALHGAVSAETAGEMVRGVTKNLNADVGLAVTGIAGPGGDTDEKPIGLVYIAISVNGRETVNTYNFKGSRERIRRRTAVTALDLLRRAL